MILASVTTLYHPLFFDIKLPLIKYSSMISNTNCFFSLYFGINMFTFTHFVCLQLPPIKLFNGFENANRPDHVVRRGADSEKRNYSLHLFTWQMKTSCT